MSGVTGNGHGINETVPLPLDEQGQASCSMLDGMLGESTVVWMAKSTPLVAASPQRVLLGHGSHVVDLDVSDAAMPFVRGSLKTRSVLRALRMNAAGTYAYGVGTGGPKHRYPVLDLRQDTLTEAGHHTLGDWVERSDAGRLSARALSPHSVEVAKVVR